MYETRIRSVPVSIAVPIHGVTGIFHMGDEKWAERINGSGFAGSVGLYE